MLEILSGKLAPTRRKGGPALAGKSTLNRLERLAGEGDERYHKIAYRTEEIDRLFVDNFLRSQKRAPGRIVLDIWTPPTTRCTAVRRGVSSTAITVITATFRFTLKKP